jgi:hypothetical protein
MPSDVSFDRVVAQFDDLPIGIYLDLAKDEHRRAGLPEIGDSCVLALVAVRLDLARQLATAFQAFAAAARRAGWTEQQIADQDFLNRITSSVDERALAAFRQSKPTLG